MPTLGARGDRASDEAEHCGRACTTRGCGRGRRDAAARLDEPPAEAARDAAPRLDEPPAEAARDAAPRLDEPLAEAARDAAPAPTSRRRRCGRARRRAPGARVELRFDRERPSRDGPDRRARPALARSRRRDFARDLPEFNGATATRLPELPAPARLCIGRSSAPSLGQRPRSARSSPRRSRPRSRPSGTPGAPSSRRSRARPTRRSIGSCPSASTRSRRGCGHTSR